MTFKKKRTSYEAALVHNFSRAELMDFDYGVKIAKNGGKKEGLVRFSPYNPSYKVQQAIKTFINQGYTIND